MLTNRIIDSITTMRAQIEKRISDGIVTRKQVDDSSDGMNMSFTEWTLFQNTKSLAHASGVLQHDEATTVHAALGSSPEEFNSNDVATKVIMTKLFEQLLKWKRSKR